MFVLTTTLLSSNTNTLSQKNLNNVHFQNVFKSKLFSYFFKKSSYPKNSKNIATKGNVKNNTKKILTLSKGHT